MSEPDPIRPVVLVTGGVSPHVAVLHRLRALGYSPVLVDYLPDPVAAPHADRHLQISTLDPDAVIDAARSLGAVQVVNVSLDQPLPVVAQVREALGLPSPLSSRAAHLLTDKEEMKRVLAGAGVAVARSVVVRSPEQARDCGLAFPVVAKPVGGTGSLGIVRAADPAGLYAALVRADSFAGGRALLVEEFVAGRELSVDSFTWRGQTRLLLARERLSIWSSDGQQPQCYATIAPAAVSDGVQPALESLSADVARAFGIADGPLSIQGILRPDGGFVVLEVAGRIGGGPGSNRVIELKSGFPYVNASIDVQLGRPVDLRLSTASGLFTANNIYAAGGTIAAIHGIDRALAAGLIDEVYVYRRPGDRIADTLSSRSRVLAFIARAPDREAMRDRIDRIHAMIDITDDAGRSILRRDFGYHLAG